MIIRNTIWWPVEMRSSPATTQTNGLNTGASVRFLDAYATINSAADFDPGTVTADADL